MNPNIYVGRCEGSAIYLKWYYEAIVDHVETVSHLAPHIRIGWANTEGFVPYPGAGSSWGANGVGDDLFSYGFDGVNLWTGEFVPAEKVMFLVAICVCLCVCLCAKYLKKL